MEMVAMLNRVDMGCRVWDTITWAVVRDAIIMSRRMRHIVNVVPMLNLINMCRRMRYRMVMLSACERSIGS